MAASVSYRINGKYDGKAIAQAQSGMSALSSSAKTLKSALSLVGVTASFTALVKSIKDATNTYKENNKVQTQMFQALSNNAKTAKSNIAGLVKEFDSMSGIFGGSDIVKGGTLLARMGLDEDQMRATAKAAKDLAASGIMTLDQAFDSLGKSYSGNIASLKKLFPELKELTAAELEAGKAVEILGKKFAGMEDALGGSFEGQITILQDKIGSIKDTIGTMGGFLLQSGFNDMSSLLDKVSDVANKFMPSIAAWTSTIIHSFANFDIAKIFDPKTTFEAWKNMFQTMAKNFLAVFDYLKAQIKGVWSKKQLEDNQIMLAQMKKSYSEYSNKTGLSKLEQESVNELKNTIHELEESIAEQQDLMKVKGKSLAELMSELVYNTGDGMKKNLSLISGENMTSYYESQRDAYGKYAESNYVAGTGVTAGGATTEKRAGGGIWGLSLEDQAKALKEGIIGSLGDVGTVIQSAMEGTTLNIWLKLISDAISVVSNKTTVLTELFSSFSAFLNEVFTPEVITMLNQFLGPVMETIVSLGKAFGSVFSVIAEIIAPVLLGLSKSISLVAKVIETIGAVVYNIYAAVYNGSHWFSKKKEYKSISDIWSDSGNTDYGKYTTGASGSSSSMSYNAARDIIVTINYNSSYVNGDAREIALNLRAEIAAAERLGL